MKQFGGGDQFGPLLVAARTEDRSDDQQGIAGVGVIGWVAAAAILVAIVGIWLWNVVLTKDDSQIKEKRKQSESEQLQLPDEAAF